MRLDQSSTQISDLVDRIQRGELDLQPNFQRGQVWPEPKKRRLIDTILREWYIPAIHIVVQDSSDSEEVLDGQQRLRTIIEFMDGKFPVDGTIEPGDEAICHLDGLFYDELPTQVRSKFRRFSMPIVRLRNYSPEEPGELFFRLNQLTALTAAEQRNALIGEPRNQIKRLAGALESRIEGRSIGFSNARMNLDDTLARLALTLESGGLSTKITASRLENRYRTGRPFTPHVIGAISNSIDALTKFMAKAQVITKLNRATLYSWLYFFIDYKERLSSQNSNFFMMFFASVEAARNPHGVSVLLLASQSTELFDSITEDPILSYAINIFNDRASSRVNDVSSVLLRDFCLNLLLLAAAPDELRDVDPLVVRKARLRRMRAELEDVPQEVAERAFLEAHLSREWEGVREAG